jgi:hypothetical protein
MVIDAFSPGTLAADLAELKRIFADFFANVSDWSRPTEKNGGGWTMHQVTAHLATVATFYQLAIEATLNGIQPTVENYTARTDLHAFNDAEIARRENLPPQALIEELFRAFDASMACAESLTPAQLSMTMPVFVYNRPLSVAAFLGAQLAHPGIIHGAQIANGAGAKPIWTHYSQDMMRRQLSRYFSLISYAYWPERGGDLRATLNFRIRGSGVWHLILNPDGGGWGEGAGANAAFTLWATNADIFCEMFTLQRDVIGTILTGKAFAWGNILLGFKMPTLFLP